MDYIAIARYKSIKLVKLKLMPINILIGANGSGKSNFLSFFEFLNRLYEQKLTEYVALSGGEDKMLHKGSKISNNISAIVKHKRNAYSFKIEKGEDNFVFVKEGLWYDGNPYIDNPQEISNYGSEAKVKLYSSSRALYIQEYLNSFKKYHFHDTSKNAPFTMKSHIENDIYYLYEKGNNLAAFLYWIQHNKKKYYKRIIKTIQSIAPYFSDFYLRPNKKKYVRLLWNDKFSDQIYGVNDLSDGTIRFIALTTLFMQPNPPATIIIDEPELGLHPTAIAKLAGMIKSISSKECQVIVATQSTELISHFTPEDIITVDQIDGESVFERLDSKALAQWLEDYTIDDLWKRNIITKGQPNY